MSNFAINLSETDHTGSAGAKRGARRVKSLVIGALVILFVGIIGGYLYWQSVKTTPQYSLALLVEAARRDDKEKVAQIIDTEQVVNNFVPQISERAVELYGRNLAPAVINRISLLVAPLMPGIREKAKEELPQLIRENTESFNRVPWWAIALFADRALEIKIEGNTAAVKSKTPEKPVEFTMKRDGKLWRITSVKDENLARRVAERVGQQLMELAKNGSLPDAANQLGVSNLGNILKGLNDIIE